MSVIIHHPAGGSAHLCVARGRLYCSSGIRGWVLSGATLRPGFKRNCFIKVLPGARGKCAGKVRSRVRPRLRTEGDPADPTQHSAPEQVPR